MQWEYAIERWHFDGPRSDDWPGCEDFRREFMACFDANLAESETEAEVNRIETAQAKAWREWRDNLEQSYLNSLGQAGYELVSVYVVSTKPPDPRDRGTVMALLGSVTRITTTCYLKRVKQDDAPPKPTRPIGFQPDRA